MDQAQGLLRQILIWLSDRHDNWLRNTAEPLSLHDEIAVKYPKLDVAELESLTKVGKHFRSDSRFVFLEPIEKGAVQPVMSVHYDFRGDVPELHLQIALFKIVGGRLIAIGFRFETPEGCGPDGTGDHNSYHSQLITSIRHGAQNHGLPCQEWLPESYPALVIDATNVVTLMICTLLSLYGRSYEKALMESKFCNPLKRYVQELGWNDTGTGRNSRLKQDAGGKWFVKTR